MKNSAVGQRVAYSREFVRNAGGSLYEIAALRGIVVELRGDFGGDRLVRVAWEGETEPMSVLACHLVRAEKGSAVQDPA